jgi:hypothetical protein
MRILVDGQLRFEHGGGWSSVEAAIGIGPCFGSTVTVRSFSVD